MVDNYVCDEDELFNNSCYELDKKLNRLGLCFPMKKDIFNAFNLCRLQDVKVIIIGQDPYYLSTNLNGVEYPIANGLAFSVNPFVNIPSSLRNIFKELMSDLDVSEPTSGDLRLWAAKGVFLINMCLTVDPIHKAGSHGQIWKGFVLKAIKEILLYHLFYGVVSHRVSRLI